MLEFLQSLPYKAYFQAYSPYIYLPYVHTFALFWQTALFCSLLFMINRFCDRNLFMGFGWRATLFVSWLGTIIHELSHAALAKLFGHRISTFKPFSPNKATGRLGMVETSWTPAKNPLLRYYREVAGNIFIALAPFIGGTLGIYLLVKWFFPQYVPLAAVENGVRLINLTEQAGWEIIPQFWKAVQLYSLPIASGIFKQEFLSQWQYYLMLYLMLSISSGIGPSSTDFRVLRGYLLRFLLFFWAFGWAIYGMFYGATYMAAKWGWIQFSPKLIYIQMITFVNGILLFVLMISAGFTGVIFLLAQLKIKLLGYSRDSRQ